MPRDSAQSSTPPTSAPDCDRKASLPGFGLAMPKLALTPSAGTEMPRQFGPMMRRQVGRAASSILWRELEAKPGGDDDRCARALLAPAPRSGLGRCRAAWR